MSYYKDWEELIGNQTDDTFSAFWEKYSDAERKIYSAILADNCKKVTGTFKELTEEYDVEPTLFMGFLDGVNTSLKKELKDLKKVEDDSKLEFEVDPEKLFFNMHVADAPHLYELPEWDQVLPQDKREEIEREYRKSKTIVKEKTPGRNDPCPCGSGKKYKKCCGAV